MILPVLYSNGAYATGLFNRIKTRRVAIHSFHEDTKLIGTLFDSQR